MRSFLVFWLMLVVFAFLTGCSGQLKPTGNLANSQGISWPPPNPVRAISDHDTVQQGVEYVAVGGNAAEFGNDLVMVGEGGLPWAIYAIGNLDYENELLNIAAVDTVTPDEPGDGTALFYAVANYNLKSWEWVDAPNAENPWVCPETEAYHYRNDLGYAHLVVVLSGPGTGKIDSVSFTHETQITIVDAPDNLTAETTAVHEATLDWDDVPGAGGYNVFRSTDADFSSQAQVNSEPVLDSTYVDSVSTDGRYYFYRVTALATNESDPSNIARAWIFGDDLPAPSNLQVTGRGDGSFTAGWDWDDPVGGNPYGFRLFIDTVPFFTMASETMAESTTFGAARSKTFHGLEPGVTYYWKLCAYDGMSSPNGRMSEEMTGTGTGSWTWGAFEVIGEGKAPVRAVVGDSEIAVTYFNGLDVDFAIQHGNNWRIETPLPSTSQMPGDTNPAGSFVDYQDVCFGDGCYLVAAHSHETGDCWVSTWNTSEPEDSWSSLHIHGDGYVRVYDPGSGRVVPAPKSGFYLTAVASESEFAVLQYYLSETELILHTRDFAEDTWTEEIIKDSFTSGASLSFSLAALSGNFYALATDTYSDELYFGDLAGGWAWSDVRDASQIKLSKYHDLHRFNDEWWSTGYISSAKDLYIINGTNAPWSYSRRDGAGGVNAGYYARMDVEGDEAVVIQYKDSKYYFALHSEGWDWSPINVPGVADYGADADVLLRNGTPYIVFQDEDTNEIKIAMGTPPM